jgi:hypothetical protein
MNCASFDKSIQFIHTFSVQEDGAKRRGGAGQMDDCIDQYHLS